MAARKGVKKRRNARGHKGGEGELRVRMYRVGFGDFFLLTVPSEEGPQHILIDCGVTRGTSGKGDIGTIDAAVRHMAEETDRTLALIIVTHRHQDHILGFNRCWEAFRHFKVGAIWMSYWETQLDSEVMAYQAQLDSLAFDVQRQPALNGTTDPSLRAALGMLENATGISLDGPAGRRGNAHTLELLRSLVEKPSYLHRGQQAPLPAPLVAAGLEARILGPPSREAADFLRLNDLKKGIGQYLSAGGEDVTAAETRLEPFGSAWTLSPGRYPEATLREWAHPSQDAGALGGKRPVERVAQVIADVQPAMLLEVAKKFDKTLNNQSLVVLFTWRGKKLLFAGDAQAGNWVHWLYDLEKPSKLGGEQLTEASQALLGELDFYKVGHHGSTNATPIAAVNAMGKGLAAMCSTEANTYGSAEKESEVPRIPLLDALNEKCEQVVRSDDIAFELEGRKVEPVSGGCQSLPRPGRGGRFAVGPGYVDYLLDASPPAARTARAKPPPKSPRRRKSSRPST